MNNPQQLIRKKRPDGITIEPRKIRIEACKQAAIKRGGMCLSEEYIEEVSRKLKNRGKVKQ